MPWFCIHALDNDDSATLRQQYRDQHLAALQTLNAAGRLLAAGPLMGHTQDDAPMIGSMLIIDFDDLETAHTWFSQESYYTAGVYKSFSIYPYVDAMPYC